MRFFITDTTNEVLLLKKVAFALHNLCVGYGVQNDPISFTRFELSGLR